MTFLGQKLAIIQATCGVALSPKDVAKMGARLCIGTCSNIPLKDNPWVENGSCILAVNTGNAQFRTAHMDALTHQNTKACKPNLVYNLFDQNTADAILNTSLFPQVTTDTLVWKGEKSGCYFEVLLS